MNFPLVLSLLFFCLIFIASLDDDSLERMDM
jgi:hypothetical protein